jgi:hypothetical protein
MGLYKFVEIKDVFVWFLKKSNDQKEDGLHKPIRINLQVCNISMIVILLGGSNAKCMKHDAKNVYNVN